VTLRFTLLDTHQHDRNGFICGEATLDAYLRGQAGQHQRDGIATTHVLVDDGDAAHILGYCSLAAAQTNIGDLQPADRKRLPAYPVPAVRIGRLAVSSEGRGKGYGRLLLGHAMNCGMQLRIQLGVKVVLVDALNERAAAFYRLHGFRETANNALTLYLPLGKG
jgi:ribosomal protein S18 acetylase RimI-like enzyme